MDQQRLIERETKKIKKGSKIITGKAMQSKRNAGKGSARDKRKQMNTK